MEENKNTDSSEFRENISTGVRKTLRPDLNGVLIKLPNQNEIYLIDQGYKRHVPNIETYHSLFGDEPNVVVDIDINEIPTGSPISSGAVLARGDGTDPIYLVDNGEKRHILDWSVLEKYQFSKGVTHVVLPILLDYIRNGPGIG